METHVPTNPQSQLQSLPNQPFFSWVRTQTALFVGQIIGLLGVVTVPIALFYYSKHSFPEGFEWQKLEKIGHYVINTHLFFLVLFIAFLIRGLDKNSMGRYRARLVHEKLRGTRATEDEFDALERYSITHVSKFKHRFLWFWCSMLCLYLVFAIEPMFPVSVGDCLDTLSFRRMFRTELFPLISFALNNLSLIFVFCCFSVLYVPPGAIPKNSRNSANRTNEANLPKSEAGLAKRTWLRFCGLIRRLARYLSGRDLDQPERRQRILVEWFIFGVAVLTVMFPLIMLSKANKPTNWSEYPAVFDALSGTINAIVLALLIAKLDSKLIGLPSWLICILYFYAGVQPMFVVFELHPEVYAGIKTAVLWVVFIFKIYFFLIIFYALQTGRVFNYFFCSQQLNDHVNTLKQPLPTKSVLHTQRAEIRAEKNTESVNRTCSKRTNKEEEDIPQAPAPQRSRASWVRSLGGHLFSRLKQSPQLESEASPTPHVERTDPEPVVGISAQQGASEKDQSPAPNAIKQKDTRARWFLGLGKAAIIIFASSLLIYVLLSEELKQSVDQSELSSGVIALHIILLLIVLSLISVFVIRDRRSENKRDFLQTNESKFRRAAELRFRLSEPMSQEARESKFDELSVLTKNQFRSFTHSFRLFWISLLLLYLAMGASLGGLKPSQKYWTSALVLNMAMGVTLPSWPGGSYLSQNQKPSENCPPGTDASSSKESQAKPPLEAENRLAISRLPKNTIYSFVFFVINNLSVLFLFWCFAVLYIPNNDEDFAEKHRLLRRYSVLIWVLLTILIPLLAVIVKGNGFTPSEAQKIPTILGAAGGTLNAVAFALLIARLDSRLIGLRLPMVVVLYAYASLQPLFVTFNQPSNLLKFIATSAMVAAFLFKICLVLVVGHVRKSGGLIDYLWFFPVLSNSVNSVFGNQFEIRTFSPTPDRFTFSIFNKNVEMYRAVKIFDTRTEVDDKIKKLVEAMQYRKNYDDPPQNLQGTYWVQVKADEELLCESVGLVSRNQVDHLINESIEKVPYCKYDRG